VGCWPCVQLLGKQPGHEIDSADGHAHAEHDAREQALDPPSPNANVTPPTTIDTRLNPRAIGPVKLVIKTLTAFSQGEACA
jgi:hypothetical protein